MPTPSASQGDISQIIRKVYEEEQKNPPVPRKYGDIPISYEAITAEWLTATLAPDTTGTLVKTFTLGPKDDGSSNRRRIELEWEGPDAASFPTSVFCKAAHSVGNRIMLSGAGTYSEVLFYNSIRPLVDVEAPTAYFAGYDPKSWASMIMLNDISDRVTFGSHKTILTKTQFAEQIQTLARLHGKFYQSKEPFFENLIGYKEQFDNLVITIDIETVCRTGFLAAKSAIPPRVFAREAEIWPVTVKSVERNASLPQTMVHGDVHLGNWYITRDHHMGLADWQAMARGHWSRDLAYVLGSGVTPENRRLWEHEMVRLYCSEFEKAGGPKTDESEAWSELRKQAVGAIWYWTLAVIPSDLMPESMQSNEASLEFIGRLTTLIDDHDALDAFNS
ncbi:hypothetical protein NM208_g8002 [Fusarium decemcellulare]|uniref:Uncharacterized protein n=1 Tax=Fusarium decemcellulare TaxID=57161 RepID=A0ACC1S746_9HYPO|nr:hypothetical protein NM208_g8002 [Fusarium decemcellulare]